MTIPRMVIARPEMIPSHSPIPIVPLSPSYLSTLSNAEYVAPAAPNTAIPAIKEQVPTATRFEFAPLFMLTMMTKAQSAATIDPMTIHVGPVENSS